MATGCGNQGLGVMKGKAGDRMWELGWNQGLGVMKGKDGSRKGNQGGIRNYVF